MKTQQKVEDLPFDIPNSWAWIRQTMFAGWTIKKIKRANLPYLEAKLIRKKADPIYVNSGVIVDRLFETILVDGENSSEIMTSPMRGYMGSTFNFFQLLIISTMISCY